MICLFSRLYESDRNIQYLRSFSELKYYLLSKQMYVYLNNIFIPEEIIRLKYAHKLKNNQHY